MIHDFEGELYVYDLRGETVKAEPRAGGGIVRQSLHSASYLYTTELAVSS